MSTKNAQERKGRRKGLGPVIPPFESSPLISASNLHGCVTNIPKKPDLETGYTTELFNFPAHPQNPKALEVEWLQHHRLWHSNSPQTPLVFPPETAQFPFWVLLLCFWGRSGVSGCAQGPCASPTDPKPLAACPRLHEFPAAPSSPAVPILTHS